MGTTTRILAACVVSVVTFCVTAALLTASWYVIAWCFRSGSSVALLESSGAFVILFGILILATIAGIIAGLHVEESRHRRRVSRMQCGTCGYDMRGSLAADRYQCPECGAYWGG